MKANELPSRCPLLHEQRPGRSRLRAVPVVIRALRDACLGIGSGRPVSTGLLLRVLAPAHTGAFSFTLRPAGASLRPLTPERPPASVSDMHSGLAAKKRALDLRGCEASPDHVGQQLDRKPMR
jgi:hypothetical protein